MLPTITCVVILITAFSILKKPIKNLKKTQLNCGNTSTMYWGSCGIMFNYISLKNVECEPYLSQTVSYLLKGHKDPHSSMRPSG